MRLSKSDRKDSLNCNVRCFGCGVGYFYQPISRNSGLALLPSLEFIHDDLSQVTTTLSVSIDIGQNNTEKNLILGFHFRIWDKWILR